MTDDNLTVLLKDKVVLVTGGSRGIGRAIALRLAKDGPEHVVITYWRNLTAARDTEKTLHDMGVNASIYCAEISRESMLNDLFTFINEKFGRLDIFINNAAITSFNPIQDISAKTWKKNMDINVNSFFQCSKLAAAQMKNNGGGVIIALSSLGSMYALPNYAALGTAKSAIESLARYLASELAQYNINVNVVSGGFIETESMRMMPNYNEFKQHIISHTPANRIGTPDDIAAVVRALCLPEMSWLRGQTLIADGGFSLVC